jgi:hypothetical protein
MERNLFWARIMKEHAIFIESALTPVLEQQLLKARQFRQHYAVLLAETIRLSEGTVTVEALRSGQYYTRFTEAAEREVARLTGIDTDSDLTQSEHRISPSGEAPSEGAVRQLNSRLTNLTKGFIAYKSGLFESQAACRIASTLYLSDLYHMLTEAQLYLETLEAMERRDEAAASENQAVWTENMAGHAKSMRGQFDTAETHYFNEAHRLALALDALAAEPEAAAVLPETENLAFFKADTTRSLLECQVKAIMTPLFTDHMLREANHFIRLLKL